MGSAPDGTGAVPPHGATGTATSDHAMKGDVLYRLLVGELASHRGDLQLALENYLDVAQATGDAAVAARATKLAVFAHAEESALDAARLWVEADPSNVEGRQVLASLLIRAGDIDGAVEHLDEIVKAESDPPGTGFHRAADILGTEKDTEAAAATMRRLVRGHRNDAEAQLALARLLVRIGRDDEAMEVLVRAYGIDPDNARIAVLQARLRRRANDSDGAFDVLEEYLERVPASGMARMAYARMLVDARRFEDARAEFERLVAEAPDNDDAGTRSGCCSCRRTGSTRRPGSSSDSRTGIHDETPRTTTSAGSRSRGSGTPTPSSRTAACGAGSIG